MERAKNVKTGALWTFVVFFLLVVTKSNQGLISKHEKIKKRETWSIYFKEKCGFQKMCNVGQRYFVPLSREVFYSKKVNRLFTKA